MTKIDPGLRGYSQRLQLSAAFFAGTMVEILEVIGLALVAGLVAQKILPNTAATDEGTGAFLGAWGFGLAAGAVYILYRLIFRMALGRAMVVPIPSDPNVDWYITLRAVGMAASGVVLGLLALGHGLAGDTRLRFGGSAPFVDAVVGCLAVGLLYLGLAKLIGRFAARR